VALAACSGGGAGIVPAPRSLNRTGLILTDIHFNPLTDPLIANNLAQTPIWAWDAVFRTSTHIGYSQPSGDTNFPLLQSVLTAMKKQTPSPDIVFIPGELDALFAEYSGTVTFGIFAHEHYDDFRVLRDAAAAQHTPSTRSSPSRFRTTWA
jgi:hypothetical protein